MPPAKLPRARRFRQTLEKALRESDWSVTKAAKLLGVSRQRLYQKADRYGADVTVLREPKNVLARIPTEAGRRGAVFYALAKSRGNSRKAAKMLGIPWRRLYGRMPKRYGISLYKTQRAFQRDRLKRAFIAADGNVFKASKALGFSVPTVFYESLKHVDLTIQQLRSSLNLPRRHGRTRRKTTQPI